MRKQFAGCRPAFTLIELLVVVVLIMVLAGLAATFLPTIGDNARVANGASMLQQWILTAKQKALRDQVPCGIRVFVPYSDPLTNIAYSGQVRQCQFIEQPDDYPLSGGSSTLAGAGTVATITPVDTTIILNVTSQIAPGDYLEVLGGGLMHLITGIKPATVPGAPITLTLASGLPKTYSTKQYRIVRAPRPTADDLLQLPDSVIIDVSTNAAAIPPKPNALPLINGSYDIVFSPSGAVVLPATPLDTINLWVRDVGAGPTVVNAQQTGQTARITASSPHGLNPGDWALVAGVAVDGYNGTWKVSSVPDAMSFTYATPTSGMPSSNQGTACGVFTGEQTIIAIGTRSGLTNPYPPAAGPNPYFFIK